MTTGRLVGKPIWGRLEVWEVLTFYLNPTNEQAVADLLIRLGRQGGFSAYGAWWTITEYKFSSEVKSSVAVLELLDLAIDDLRREEVTVGDLERLKKGNFRKDVLRRWKQKYPSDVR